MDTNANENIWLYFGEDFKDLRNIRGETQERIAKESGISESEVRKIEKGEARLEMQTFLELEPTFGPDIFYILLQSYYRANARHNFDPQKEAVYRKLLQQFYKILSEYDDSYINASFKCEYLDFQGNKGAANSRASSRISYYDF